VARRTSNHGASAVHGCRAQDLDAAAAADQPGLGQRGGVDLGSIREAAQLGDVDHRVDLLERVLEAGQLRQALRQRHLAALETEAKAFAPGVLALLAAPRGLAPSGAGAAAYAPRLAVRPGGWLQ